MPPKKKKEKKKKTKERGEKKKFLITLLERRFTKALDSFQEKARFGKKDSRQTVVGRQSSALSLLAYHLARHQLPAHSMYKRWVGGEESTGVRKRVSRFHG